MNNVIETEQKTNAASTIQNAIKSKKARAELKQNKELKSVSNAVVEDMQNQLRKQQEPYINAGTKIQKVVRGHKARKQLPEIKEEYDRQQLTNQMNNAASTMQGAVKGYKARAKTERLKKYKDAIAINKSIASNITKPPKKPITSKRYYEALNEEPSYKRQSIKDTTTEDTVRDVINDMVKRIEKVMHYKKLKFQESKKVIQF